MDRGYIEGSPFRLTVITDHHSLLWLNNLKNPTGKLARWSIKLREHTFDLVHRKGCLNIVPDFLSRIPAKPESSEVAIIDIVFDQTDNWYQSVP